MDELKIDIEFEDIKMLNKSKLKNMVKQKLVSRALDKLEEKKESHWRVNQIQYRTAWITAQLRPDGACSLGWAWHNSKLV